MSCPHLSQIGADVFVPEGIPPESALARTTHLGIVAHADDLEFLAAHGIEACYDSEDRWFTGIVMTDGAGSARTGRFATLSNADMVAVRQQEQRQAAQIGRYSAVIQLGHPSASVKNATDLAPTLDLQALLALMRPAKLTVYLHNPADRHDTHVAVLLRSLAALRQIPPAERPRAVFGCEVWRSLDWLVDDDRIALPTGTQGDLLERLTAVFASQIEGGKRYDRAVPGRQRANATFHDSHRVDAAPALTFAMDLAPLVADDSLAPATFVAEHVRHLADDIARRISRLDQSPS